MSSIHARARLLCARLALPRLRRFRRELPGLVLLLGAIALTIGPAFAEFVAISSERIAAPFDLEWLESSMLIGARRFWNGDGLYTALDFEYIPLIYPPGIFILLGVVQPFEPAQQYLLGRLLALGCLLLTQYLLWRICAPRYGRATALVLALSPLSFFVPGGYWLDIIRIDNFYLMLIFAAVAAQLSAISAPRRVVLSSLLFVAAVFSKQSAIVLLPALSIYWLLGGQIWRGIQQLLCIALLTIALVAFWQLRTDGIFWEYVWLVGQSHGYAFDSLELALHAFVEQQYFALRYLDLLEWLLGAGMLIGAFAVARSIFYAARRRQCLPQRLQIDGFLGALGCGLIVMSALLTAHVGSYWNNNLPALYGYCLLALVCSRLLVYPAWAYLRRRWSRRTAHIAFLRLLRWVPPVLLLWMAAHHMSTPLRQYMPVPEFTQAMRAEREILHELIQRGGPALYPEQPPVAFIADAPPHYHLMGLMDLRKRPQSLSQSSIAGAPQLARFRFALSAVPDPRYSGFEMRRLEEVGLRPRELRYPVSGDFYYARYIFVRAAEADAEVARLRAIVSELRQTP